MIHTPIRMCVVCRTRRPQRELVRIARSPEGIDVDPGNVLPGRGAYVCPDSDCVRDVARRKGHAVRRALRVGDDPEAVAAISRITTRMSDVTPSEGRRSSPKNQDPEVT